jgi:hypothetical protein
MAWLKNTITGKCVGDLLEDGQEYQFLKGLIVPGTGGGLASSATAPVALYEEIGLTTLEHLVAGDTQNVLSEVPELNATGYQTMFKMIDSLGAAQDLTEQIGTVQDGGVVTSIDYIPTAAVNGAATNSRTLSVTDNGSLAAAGTPVTSGSLALVAGVNLIALADNAIPVTTGACADGDVLEYKSIHSGTGLADPGGLLIVTLNGYAYTAPDYSNAGYIDPHEGGAV